MRPRKFRLQQTLAASFGQASTLPVPMPEMDFVTGVIFDFQIPLTLATPVAYQDFVGRLLSSFTFGGKGKPLFSVGAPDIRSLIWAMMNRGGERPPNLPAATSTLQYQLVVPFGVQPRNPDGTLNELDNTAGIPAQEGMIVAATWAPNTALGTGITTGAAAAIGVTLLGLDLDDPSEAPKYRPVWTSGGPVVKQAAGLRMVDNLAQNQYERRTTLLCLSGANPADDRTDGNTGAGNASAVSEIGVSTASQGQVLYLKTWDFTKLSQRRREVATDNTGVPGAAAAYGAATIAATWDPGVGTIDWFRMLSSASRAKADGIYGLNTYGQPANAASVLYTVDTAVNTQIITLHESYEPLTQLNS
jgi:hypothetical protein